MQLSKSALALLGGLLFLLSSGTVVLYLKYRQATLETRSATQEEAVRQQKAQTEIIKEEIKKIPHKKAEIINDQEIINFWNDNLK